MIRQGVEPPEHDALIDPNPHRASAAGIAKILFFVFLVVSVMTFILGVFRRR